MYKSQHKTVKCGPMSVHYWDNLSLLRQPYGSVMHSILPDISGFCRYGSNIVLGRTCNIRASSLQAPSIIIIHIFNSKLWYGDSVENAVENSSIFSLIRMHCLPSARAGSKTLHQHPPVLNWTCQITQVGVYNGCKTLVVVVNSKQKASCNVLCQKKLKWVSARQSHR